LSDPTAFGNAWGDLPSSRGLDGVGIASGAASGEIKVLILCGADPVRDLVGADGLDAVTGAAFVVALDLFRTDSSVLADVVLPALAFAEKEGTFTNLEGRVQKANKIVPGPGQARADWSILDDLATRMRQPIDLGSEADIAAEIAMVAPAYAGLAWEHLEWDAREGAVVPIDGATQPLQYVPVGASTSSEQVGMTVHLARTLYDDGVSLRHSPSLRGLAPGPTVGLSPDHMASLGVDDGDDVTVSVGATSVTLSVRRDASLHGGTVYVPFNQPGVAPLASGLAVTVTAGGPGS
jgi:predicted molibdopterin-dependent oxidoreductase YjgC